MAVRTGAGTGVIVSLVVFVLTTIFLLIFAIAFYVGKTKEQDQRIAAESALANYIRPQERNDAIKGIEAAAKDRRQSVVAYLNGRYEELMGYASGDPGTTVDRFKSDLGRLGVPDTGSVRSRMQDLQRDLSARQSEVEGLNSQLKKLTADLAQRDAQMQQARQAHQQEVEGFEAMIASYRKAGDDNRADVQKAINEYNQAKDNLRSRYEGEIHTLHEENDTINRELLIVKGRLAELEKARDAVRLKGQNPAMLVDGKVIDAPGASDQVYIDRGKKDHIVQGMTFEVYSSPSQLVVNPQTGELPRGKASLQVIKVADTTSTCKITRSVPGQPLVRGDVIANAVFDPNYSFKFLVHGKFDIDGDGRPTEQEAEYLRSRIMEWGGVVVQGEQLPGDLDFLVLGVEPPMPAPLPDAAPTPVIQDFLSRRAAYELYRTLFRQAQEAQIPVLNANRFLILIGHTDR